jgi:hypothetical protein
MESIEERLTASDPAAQGYTNPQFEAMVSRVAATRPASRDAIWRSFRTKVAAALTATGVLTGAGIAALSTAGVSLPVLSFAAAAHGANTPSAATSTKFSTLMRLNVNWQFTGADNFSTAPGSATVYTMTAPSDPSATLTAAASVLGVDVGTPASSDAGQSYSSTGPNYTGSVVTNGGFASWSIYASAPSSVTTSPGTSSSGTSSTSTSSTAPVSSDAFNSTALADAHQLGTFDLGAPVGTDESGNGAGPFDVTVPILIGGRATDFAYDFSFASDGTLQSADGVGFSLAPLGDYPLISPSAAVDQINSQLYVTTAFAGGGIQPMLGSSVAPTTTPGGPTTPTTGVNGSGPPVATPTDTTPPDTTPTNPVDSTTTTLPPTVVNLTAETTQYGAYSMTNGSTLLLPVYIYDGDVVGQGWQATFRVIPVDPNYLDLSTVTRPGIF